ncbi:MAG TPA: Holliday junction branch migration protein RuvA [Syntrophales bacterium]|nr:Holliday junction branch migration protein RuvA [Syntrophales bacterium]HOX95392.1 Holliday junction branch migration protein RuvA [Syntrophales bacterium]HPI56445.1 Holliday junction branch migration protein RuvA [Syntrophales bacterium]HPN24167.1 Holliday junction branch migration protein RuvA [Syntrophales bacterium]HQM28520.1 Holliday junction branch migration protein RuvA [Syntrophales bacterium]
MIASLNGTLTFKSPGHITVDVSGIGYRVFIPLSTFYELSDEGTVVRLHIFTAVREDAMHLFGFCTSEEKQLFEMLLTVNGIGPKLALSLLSGITPKDFIGAVFAEDRAALTRVPGVGKKMAERIILELRDKLVKLDGAAAGGGVRDKTGSRDVLHEDALSALVNLGYKKSTAKTVLDRLFGDSPDMISLEEALKKALQMMS